MTTEHRTDEEMVPGAEVIASVTGYIVEAGNIGMGLRHADQKSLGVVLECGDRYIEVRGLGKDECRSLARKLTQEVILRITPVKRP
jgi:hypothetical protein